MRCYWPQRDGQVLPGLLLLLLLQVHPDAIIDDSDEGSSLRDLGVAGMVSGVNLHLLYFLLHLLLHLLP